MLRDIDASQKERIESTTPSGDVYGARQGQGWKGVRGTEAVSVERGHMPSVSRTGVLQFVLSILREVLVHRDEPVVR